MFIEASYVVAPEKISKKKKTHTSEKTLIKPQPLKILETVLGNGLERNFIEVSLASSILPRRISNMNIVIKD